MPELNPEHVKQVLALINEGPYFQLLSIEVRDLGVGYSVVEADYQTKHLNPFGGIHGGVYASLVDTATFWVLYGRLPEEAGWVTADLKVNYLAPILEGKLIVHGKLIKFGRTLSLTEAEIRNEQGALLAIGTSALIQTSGGQTVESLARQKGIALLPKFL